MVMNMMENNLIKKIEDIFKQLNFLYDKLDLDDEDINYSIKISTFGKLKVLNHINAIVYFHQLDFSMNIIVFNIFTLNDDNNNIDTLDIYELVNEINSELLCGSYLVLDNKSIFFRSSMYCGSNFSELNASMMKRQIDIFIESLEKLFLILEDKERNNE